MSSSALDPAALPAWHAALLALPALAAGLAALACGPSRGVDAAWRTVRGAATLALVASAASLAAVMLGGGGSGFGLRGDVAGGIVLVLVAFVGLAIARYSAPYLDGQPGLVRYARWLAATLAAVALVVVTDHVLVLALAWTAASVSLHRLLTFFDHRPAAVLAAHKKRIAGRVADACMLAAVALLYLAFDTTRITELIARAAEAPGLPAVAQLATVLVAFAALLKCAQLPFHGWLIQVMEAPTPVSALLHAGVVNLGGFVLIRLAPLLAESLAAQALLVAVGTFTAVVAALVMTTRISIKVALAWSTCAQMGFMLMQIGLGAWEMALLHLVAHSLYKAHAFLGAGGAVRATTLARMAPAESAPGTGPILVGLALGAAAVAVAALAWSPWLHPTPTLATLAAIVVLALVPLGRPMAAGALVRTGLGGLAVALAWFGLHAALAGRVVAAGEPAAPLWVIAALGFTVLFALQCAVQAAPRGALATRLYPWFYGGLFLDERVSRAAFRLWPPPAPAAPPVAAAIPVIPVTVQVPHVPQAAPSFGAR
jgi:NAD(P)H-quinone oxidoreductase subunit 5